MNELGRHAEAEPLYRRALAIKEQVYGPEHADVALGLNNLAVLLSELGKHAEAEPLHRRALAISEQVYGSAHASVATSLNNLALLLNELGRHSEAEPLYRRALAIQEQVYGSEHAAVALGLNNLAELLRVLGNHAEAEPLYRRALAISEQVYGSAHASVATSLNNLALLLNELGRHSEAEPLYRRALAIQEQVYGSEHAAVALGLNNLAELLRVLGNHKEAEPFHRRALAIRKQIYGPEHADVASSLNILALLLNELGRHAEAEPLYRRALAIREQIYGPEHTDVATSLNNIAELLRELDRHAEAEPLHRRALAISEQVYGPEHHQVASGLNNLAVLLNDLGRDAEAEPLHRRALAIREQVYGPEHADVASSVDNLASLLNDLGRHAEAEPLYRRALAIREQVYGPEHDHVATSLNNLAFLLNELGNHAEAEPLYRRALAIWEQVFGLEHTKVATSLNNLASLLNELGNHAEAEPLYRRALAIREQVYGPEHADVASSLNNLAGFLNELGRHAEAEQLYRRALAIWEQVYGSEHADVALGLNNLAALLNELGKHAESEQLLLRSIAMVDGSKRHAYFTYSNLLAATGRNFTAILFAKKTVNECQQIRRNVFKLGKETLMLFDVTVENNYIHLANLLMEADRLIEAEHVMDLLKEKEVFLALRSECDTSFSREPLPYNEIERNIDLIATTCILTLAEVSGRIAQLWREDNRSTSEQRELDELENKREAATRTYHEALEDIEQRAAANPQRVHDVEAASALEQALEEIGDGTCALYTLSDKEKFHSFLIGPGYRHHASQQMSSKELATKIAEFRKLLQPDEYGELHDPLPLAQELYNVIVRPLEKELGNTTTILWNLEGVLRYVPMAALHDGEQFLVERFNSVSLTPSTLHVIKDIPQSHWRGCGIGISKGGDDFNPLPAVRGEIAAIIRNTQGMEGILDGVRLLDEDATWERVRATLAPKGFGAIHIASHFKLNPVEMPASTLLLGNNQTITLRELSFKNNLFGGSELLTLSACNTAASNPLATGKEVDSFADLALRQGAKAVMASLWEVADESTSLLMREFYKLRESGKSKTEALRYAQLGLLHGSHNASSDLPVNRSDLQQRYRYSFNAETPYSHPFFWAPFILMGNWK